MENYLVAPAHVVNQPDAQVELCVTEYDVVKRKSTVKSSIPNPSSWKEIAADLVVTKVPDGFSLKKALVGPYSGKPLVTISTAFAQNNASCSWMTDAGFGTLEYHGSTRAGFSGAGYFCENRLVGIHLGGGVQNLAYAASYVSNLIKVSESSEYDALVRALRGARRKDWDIAATGDPDRLQVRVSGRYYLIDVEDYQRFNAEYGTSDGYEMVDAMLNSADFGYRPENNRPGNLRAPVRGRLLDGLRSRLELPTSLPVEDELSSESSSECEDTPFRPEGQKTSPALLKSTVSDAKRRKPRRRRSRSKSQQSASSIAPTRLALTTTPASKSKPQKGKTGSPSSAAPSTSKAPQVLESSKTTKTSEPPSAGTASSSQITKILLDSGAESLDDLKNLVAEMVAKSLMEIMARQT